MKLPRHIAAVMAVLVLTGMSYSASATEINVSSDKAEELLGLTMGSPVQTQPEVKHIEDTLTVNVHGKSLTDEGKTKNVTGIYNGFGSQLTVDKDLVVRGVFFDHKGETAGLGANIKERFFMDDFIGEHLLDATANFQSIQISKSNGDPENKRKEDGKVDAIAGSTLTGNGVQNMIRDGLEPYISYIKSLNK